MLIFPISLFKHTWWWTHTNFTLILDRSIKTYVLFYWFYIKYLYPDWKYRNCDIDIPVTDYNFARSEHLFNATRNSPGTAPDTTHDRVSQLFIKIRSKFLQTSIAGRISMPFSLFARIFNIAVPKQRFYRWLRPDTTKRWHIIKIYISYKLGTARHGAICF